MKHDAENGCARLHGYHVVRIALLLAAGLVVVGCGDENTMKSPAPADTPVQALYAFYGEGDVAVIDPDTLEILETASPGFSAGGGKQKSWFFDGPVWGGSPATYGLDNKTLTPIEQQHSPSVQMDRDGNVVQGGVSTASVAAASAYGTEFTAETAELLAMTSVTEEMMEQYDFCALHKGANGMGVQAASVGIAEEDPVFHHMGYGAVGNEPSPDGRLQFSDVRHGDHALFLDIDPASDTFGQVVRFIDHTRGEIKDATGDVVASFNSLYQHAGGGSSGNLNWDRVDAAMAGEDDPQTYAEPCDSTILRNHNGEVWSFTPDTDGDTLTGILVDSITSDEPVVHQWPVPRLKPTTDADPDNGVPHAGPWMASLANRNAGGNEMLFFVEYEGENAQGIWDVTDAGNGHVHEIQRIYTDLSELAIEAFGDGDSFTDGQSYTITVDASAHGNGSSSVSYTYVALEGDDGTGQSPTGLTTAYLEKANDADPGPSYLVNGLEGRAGTSNGTVSERIGEGPETVVLSDEVWLLNLVGADGADIVDLTSEAPFPVADRYEGGTAFSGMMSYDGSRYFQIMDGDLEVIDVAARELAGTVAVPGDVTNIAQGTYAGELADDPDLPEDPGLEDGNGAAPPPAPCG